MRSVPEWIGKTDDTPVPPRVRLRVLQAFNHRCYLSGREIRPGDAWDIEHKIALCLGGENRESNLAPALKIPHREKTRLDRARLKRERKIQMRHAGIKPPRWITRWRRFDGSIVQAARQR